MRILFALAAAHAARLGSRKVEGRASPDENALVTRVAEVVREKHDVMTWWSAAREPSGQSIEPRGTAARVDRNESRHRGGTATQMDRSESRHRGGTAARVDRMLRGLDRSATPAPQGPTGAQVFLADRFADAVLDEKRCGAEGKWLACVDGKWRPEGVTVVSASSENGEAMVPVCELAASFDRAPHPYVTISVGENWAALSSQRINRTTRGARAERRAAAATRIIRGGGARRHRGHDVDIA